MSYKTGQVFFNQKYNSYYSIEDIIVDSKGNTWFKCYYPSLDQWATYDQHKVEKQHRYISDKAGKLLEELLGTTA
jgi:hypothetical protein